jgi:hypothetical protein
MDPSANDLSKMTGKKKKKKKKKKVENVVQNANVDEELAA